MYRRCTNETDPVSLRTHAMVCLCATPHRARPPRTRSAAPAPWPRGTLTATSSTEAKQRAAEVRAPERSSGGNDGPRPSTGPAILGCRKLPNLAGVERSSLRLWWSRCSRPTRCRLCNGCVTARDYGPTRAHETALRGVHATTSHPPGTASLTTSRHARLVPVAGTWSPCPNHTAPGTRTTDNPEGLDTLPSTTLPQQAA
jgi:hypothetical protein